MSKNNNLECGLHNDAYERDWKEFEEKETKCNLKNNDCPLNEGGVEREVWTKPVEFLLSSISMSIGLGNIWRFPFVAYENGGGAFLIPYLVILLLMSRPLYYMELCMGQFSSSASIQLWAVQPFFRGIGYAQVIVIWCGLTFYGAVIATTMHYMVASVSSVLPWSLCPSDLPNCVDVNTNLTNITNYNATISAAEVYFQKEFINFHPNGLADGIFAPDLRLSLYLLVTWIIMLCVIAKGVKSFGKAAYFIAIFPYIALLILLAKGATLPGAVNGIRYFLIPRWNKLLDPEVWFAAAGQSFFSINVGFGNVPTLASHNKFNRNIYRDAYIVSFLDTLTSLLAGFTIFAALGNQAYLMGVDNIDDVIKGGGSSIAFISYPEVIARFDAVPQVFSFLFFFMLLTVGIGATAAIVNCLMTVVTDQLPGFKRIPVTFGIAIATYFCSLIYVTPQGPYLTELVDFYGVVFIVFALAFLETIAINWFYGFRNFRRDIKFMLKRDTGIYFALCWVIISPLILITIMAYKIIFWVPLESGGYRFGPTATGLGFSLFGLSLAMIPICFVVNVAKRDSKVSIWTAIADNFRAGEGWYPKDPIIRNEYKQYLESSSTTSLGTEPELNPNVFTHL